MILWLPLQPTHKDSNRIFGGKTGGEGCPKTIGNDEWWGKGVSMDYYLAPAPGGFDFTNSLYDITGVPSVPLTPQHGLYGHL